MQRADYPDPLADVRLVDSVEHAYDLLRRHTDECTQLLKERPQNEMRTIKAAFFEAEFVLLTRLHEMLVRQDSQDCNCSVHALLDRWLTLAETPDRLQSFALLTVREFGHAHPLICVAAIRERITRNPAHSIDIEEYLRLMHCSRGAVAKLFRRHVGVSLLDYQRFVRVREALQRLAHDDTKIEVVALTVGLSKKLLYQYIGACIGMTPTRFRRLPEPERSECLAQFEHSFRNMLAMRRLLASHHSRLAATDHASHSDS